MRKAAPSRHAPAWLSLGAVLTAVTALFVHAEGTEKGKRARGRVLAAVVAAPTEQTATATSMGPSGFTLQTRLGFSAGDQWEPAIAADDDGSVYVLYPQYGGVPGCPRVASPTAILQVSRDRGASWGPPRPIAPRAPSQGRYSDRRRSRRRPHALRRVAAEQKERHGRSEVDQLRRDLDGGRRRQHQRRHRQADLGRTRPGRLRRLQPCPEVWVAASHDGGQTFNATK